MIRNFFVKHNTHIVRQPSCFLGLLALPKAFQIPSLRTEFHTEEDIIQITMDHLKGIPEEALQRWFRERQKP